jgi:hypothetical protein
LWMDQNGLALIRETSRWNTAIRAKAKLCFCKIIAVLRHRNSWRTVLSKKDFSDRKPLSCMGSQVPWRQQWKTCTNSENSHSVFIKSTHG